MTDERMRLEPSFFQFRKPNLYYDIISLEDPLPMAGIVVEETGHGGAVERFRPYPPVFTAAAGWRR